MEQMNKCSITGNVITVNGHVVFRQNPDLDFTAFSKDAFMNLELVYPKFYKMDRLCKLGFLALEYLLVGNPAFHPDKSTAIVLCNSSGSLDSDLTHLQNIDQPSPAVFVYTLPNIMIGEMAIRHGIKGETAFFICENDDDLTAQQYAADLLANGMASSSIYGWVDYTEEHYLANLNYIM
jgi:hypothetical protein